MTRKILPVTRTPVARSTVRRAVQWTAVGIATWVAASAWAAGVSGQLGPVGPIGSDRTPAPATSSEQASDGLADMRPAGRPAAQRRAARERGNRIEITGNTASLVGNRCGPGAASVNHIDVDKRALHGRTVIVQGRNVENARAACDPQDDDAGQTSTQVNSVRIR